MHKLEKHILAAYYNDARLNILYCLNDIRSKMGYKPFTDEAEIRSAFETLTQIKEPELQRNLIQLLRERFHFLDALTDVTPRKKGKAETKNTVTYTPMPERYFTRLNRLFGLINGLRNTMVHPTDEEMVIEPFIHKQLFFALNKIYDSSLHTVKTRFTLETDAVKPFLRCDNKSVAKFTLALCTNPKDAASITAIPQSKILHDFGHVLLCSLFLDKSQSAELISYFWKAYPQAPWAADQKTNIQNLVSVYRVRLPLQRLKSDNTETAVTLDTLSELSRCPRPLLNCLSPDDQNRFRGSSPSVSKSEDVEIGDDPSYLFARGHHDRFITLMMRFLDFTPDCNLQFGVDLGQLYYNVRLKPGSQFTDNLPRVRRLGQKIVGYGRLMDFERATKPKVWQQLEDNYIISSSENDENDESKNLLNQASDIIEQLKPYIVRCEPHYHYYDDKIGFRLGKSNEMATYPMLTNQDVSSNIALDALAGSQFAPEFWITPSQMLHVAFYIHLRKSQTKYLTFDVLLKSYRAGIKELLEVLAKSEVPQFSGEPFSEERRNKVQQWLDGFFSPHQGKQFYIGLGDLPDVLVRHLLGADTQRVAVEEVIARTQHLIEETKRKQKQIDDLLKMPKKRGKKGFKPIKCGHIGDFLADDLMRFQPVDTNKPDGGKINSQQYQILQAALAYYGAHIDKPPKIVDLLRDAGLLSGSFAHPFLSSLIQVDKPEQYPGLISFYQAYLTARKQYLEQFIKTNKHLQKIADLPKWLRIRQPSILQNWLKELRGDDGALLQPLPVPKNMLYCPLLAMVAQAIGTTPDALEQEGTRQFQRNGKQEQIRPSISWLVKRYFDNQNDTLQKMYRYPRQHRLFDTFLDKRTKKHQAKPVHYLSELKRQGYLKKIRKHIDSSEKDEKTTELTNMLKAYKHDEKTLRQFANQDRVLYLYAKQYFNTLQISHAASPQWSLEAIENTLLNTSIYYELPVEGTQIYLFHPECKIRKLGELSLLVRNRQLPSLLAYYPETKIDQMEIRSELASYRRSKVEAMKLVHSLEWKIVERYGAVPKRRRKPKKGDTWVLNADELTSIARFGDARHGDFLDLLYTKLQQSQMGKTKPGFDLYWFKQAQQLRNAFSHNVYPESIDFDNIVQALYKEPIPKNPTKHREIAVKLLGEMSKLYEPWLKFLNTSQ